MITVGPSSNITPAVDMQAADPSPVSVRGHATEACADPLRDTWPVDEVPGMATLSAQWKIPR